MGKLPEKSHRNPYTHANSTTSTPVAVAEPALESGNCFRPERLRRISNGPSVYPRRHPQNRASNPLTPPPPPPNSPQQHTTHTTRPVKIPPQEESPSSNDPAAPPPTLTLLYAGVHSKHL